MVLEHLVYDSDLQLAILSGISRHNVEAVLVVEVEQVKCVYLTEDMLAIETDYELITDFSASFDQVIFLPVKI